MYVCFSVREKKSEQYMHYKIPTYESKCNDIKHYAFIYLSIYVDI